MRVSEISNLKIKNLDFYNNTIYILGKGSKERIMCIANNDITKLLKKYIDIRKNNIDYVFVNKLGNNISEQSIRNMINDYATSAGIKLHITPHMFRHTFATALLDEDVDIRYIQQLLGHSSIVTTQIYTHISTNKIRHILEDKHPRNKFDL
jgi:integrase/recombinase XerD